MEYYTPLLLNHNYAQTMTSLTEKQLVELMNKAVKKYSGDSRKLANAIGYLVIGRNFGWKIMLLMHDRKSIKAYEEILAIDSKAVMPEIGLMAKKSIAWEAVQKVTNFWKAVKGEIPGVRSLELRKS